MKEQREDAYQNSNSRKNSMLPTPKTIGQTSKRVSSYSNI